MTEIVVTSYPEPAFSSKQLRWGGRVLGALLWTGYLGGAVATHVRVGNPLLSHVLFPTYIATLLWLGLWLRDARLRALLPFGSSK